MFHSPNVITLEERQLSKTENNILIRVTACAVCGYDARVFRNGHHKVRTPVILGHELCGELLQTVPVHNGKVIESGTRVIVSPIISCLNCKYCKSEQYNLCINLREIGSTVDGGFAQYISIPKQILQIGGIIPVPSALSNEEAALVEPLACCINGFYQMGKINSETQVAIIGDGPIGLIHLQLSKLYGAKTIMIGKNAERIRKAKSIGADQVVFAHDLKQTRDNILQHTDGVGTNAVIVATSNPAALNLAMAIASKNSKINIFGGMPKETHISLDPNWLHYNQISLIGSFSSTPYMLHEAARLAANKQIDLGKIISHRFSLDRIEEAIEVTEQYYGLRAVINSF
ncbi:MAG TPA: alcohol dehydrogenase catalytic domain-containing protein [Nitrososphaeraceae archaeon]|nr:alcohol dehydrogenase catalytic domain-containing protein [Nitrososphaeraceae archaeon]